jgi:glutamyl-tRNA synthetase|tara:strand:- start:116146 stop:117579 length:1434 start_codon:yes stop_codon:yes gene_type:complete
MNKVRTRFAPSPTGFLHVGSARTALFSYLFAKKHGGTFILRIEDTDKEREVKGAVEHVMESLTWLGINWDESIDCGGPHAPYKQSERLGLYQDYAQKLIATGHAYPDPYTEEEVAAFRAQAEAEKKPFLFRNHRPATFGTWDGTQPLRLKTPTIKRFVWQDVVLGELSAGEEALDDFILIKRDGYPTYNFAHVVDDIEMEITHVMRGHEFISSMPKFLSLYEALAVEPPVFATIPPILGEGGAKKLSKRDGAKDVLEYRADGYLPEAMVNFLALLGWNPGGEQEQFSMKELCELFTLERVQRSGAQFDEVKLLTLNRFWMRSLSDEEYIAHVVTDGLPASKVSKALELLRERAQTFAEAREMLATELAFLFDAPQLDAALLTQKEPADASTNTKAALGEVLTLLKDATVTTAEEARALLMPLADSAEERGKGGRGAVLWPLRYALSGQERSPDPFTLMALLGVEESIHRIERAFAIL